MLRNAGGAGGVIIDRPAACRIFFRFFLNFFAIPSALQVEAMERQEKPPRKKKKAEKEEEEGEDEEEVEEGEPEEELEEVPFTAEEEEKMSSFGYIKPRKRKRGLVYAPALQEWEEDADADNAFCRCII